ncbi:MAG: tetratricopeptide repeat protein [Pirellulaceae bacterium]|nr:tetratricopeptide repeat protein [Pirellulaceae bacterium]
MLRAAGRRASPWWIGAAFFASLAAFAVWYFVTKCGTGWPTATESAVSGDDTAAGSPDRSPIAPLLDDTRQTAASLLERFPDDPRVWDVAGRLRYLQGDTIAAVEMWEKCLQIEPQYLEARIAIGTLQFESGRFADAEQTLLAAFLQAPANGRAAYVLASTLLNQGKLEETVEVLQGHLSIDPQSLPSQVLLGQTLLQQKRPAAAKECYLAATRLAPTYANAWFGLATACSRLGQTEEAAEYRRKFQQLQRNELQQGMDQTRGYSDLRTTGETVAEVYVTAGRIYQERGDDADAERHWQRALTLDDANLEARMELAQLYQRQNRPRETLAVLSPLRESRPDDPRLWLETGRLHARLDQFELADQAFARVVELTPESAQGYAARAELRVQCQRDAAEAVQFARQAVERQPSGPHYYLLSVAAEQQGDRSLAIDSLQQAISADPGNPQYQRRYHLLRTPR